MTMTETAYRQSPIPSIFIVEDLRFTRAALGRLLREIGPCTIHEASSGNAALETMRELGGVDLIIADVKMPEMNGLELLQAVRLDEVSIPNETPFMLISDAMTDKIYDAAELLNVTGVIAKPLQRNEMANLFVQLDEAGRTTPDRSPEAYSEVNVTEALAHDMAASNTWRNKSLSRKRRLRLTEKVE